MVASLSSFSGRNDRFMGADGFARAPDIEIVEAFLAEVPRRMVFDNAAEDVR